MFTKLKNNFLTGLVIILPAVLTVAIFVFLAKQVNERLLTPMTSFLGIEFYSPFGIYIAKGIGFALTVLLIILIGAATKFILIRNFFSFWEKLLSRVPTIGKLYVTIKQISRAILGQNKQVFEQVVLIEHPRKGLFSLGFVTGEACCEIKEKAGSDCVYVFLPTTPNPTNGYFLVVPKNQILPLELSVADAFKLIISGGTVSPPLTKIKNTG